MGIPIGIVRDAMPQMSCRRARKIPPVGGWELGRLRRTLAASMEHAICAMRNCDVFYIQHPDWPPMAVRDGLLRRIQLAQRRLRRKEGSTKGWRDL